MRVLLVVQGELARAHLLVEHRPARFTFHDLLRSYATELVEAVDSPTERRAARQRLLDHYLHTVAMADPPGPWLRRTEISPDRRRPASAAHVRQPLYPYGAGLSGWG